MSIEFRHIRIVLTIITCSVGSQYIIKYLQIHHSKNHFLYRCRKKKSKNHYSIFALTFEIDPCKAIYVWQVFFSRRLAGNNRKTSSFQRYSCCRFHVIFTQFRFSVEIELQQFCSRMKLDFVCTCDKCDKRIEYRVL